MNDVVRITQALDFAARKHVGQRRKGIAKEPYIIADCAYQQPKREKQQRERRRARNERGYQAARRVLKAKALRMSCRVAPAAIKARTIRSSETEESPASILAIRD
jgi:hypothetical protein